jgi:hypothetical protein
MYKSTQKNVTEMESERNGNLPSLGGNIENQCKISFNNVKLYSVDMEQKEEIN